MGSARVAGHGTRWLRSAQAGGGGDQASERHAPRRARGALRDRRGSALAGGGRSAGASATGIGELDRVLGGGLVPGSLVLLGGSPGIGKSTLTNMALGNIAGAGHTTLYVSGEESAEQVRLRAERLRRVR